MEAIAITMTSSKRDEFKLLLERHRRIVFKVANTYARLQDDRAELAQEIATQLWRAFPGYDPSRSLSTWVYRIALNVAISFVRSNQLRRRHLAPLDDAHDDIVGCTDVSAESDQQVHALERFIAAQAPLDRALLLLYLEEHNYREIAEVLGISETNVATKISRLKQRIRTHIAA